ncbi:DsbA family protein [Herpetosiphon giganteus]|uniref:DsbA family protein n=1 Tax=Herpetosiphon giganteus TaxID=2029754 RepID=UPI00195D8DF0|nr:thioredoxin domain-containing protein [Herpetosiphon giganteus]MBM7843882.1 protein-disulfide isomerase [Herpetosiphon giganteus]
MSKSIASNKKRQSRTRKPQGGLPREVKMLLWLSIPVLVIVAVVLLTQTGANSSQPVDISRLIYADSPVLGKNDAPVTVVEFLDPECESCRAFFPIVKDVLAQNGDNVRLVVRYFPLHNNSVLAIAATEAAGNQGKYWEMQELLFTKQSEWGEKRTPQTALMLQYAQELGLDGDKFAKDLSDPVVMQKIERDNADAQALNVRGTPSFFVNGKPVATLSQSALQSAIDDAK